MAQPNYKGYSPQFEDNQHLRIAEFVSYAANEIQTAKNSLDVRLSSIELEKRDLLETAKYMSVAYRRFVKEEAGMHAVVGEIMNYRVHKSLTDIGQLVNLYAIQLLDKDFRSLKKKAKRKSKK